MADNFISKFAGLFVVLILVLVVAVPVVSTMSTTTEPSVEHEYDNASVLGVSITRGGEYYTAPETPKPLDYSISTDTLTYAYPRALVENDYYIGGGGSIKETYYFYDPATDEWVSATAPDATDFNSAYEDMAELEFVEVVSGTYEINYTIDPALFQANDFGLYIPVMHGTVSGVGTDNDTTITYSAFRCDADGTANVSGDYVSIPSLLFSALADKPYVANGATYYIPNSTCTAYLPFVAPAGTGHPEGTALYNLAFTAEATEGSTTYLWTVDALSPVDCLLDLIIPYDASYTVPGKTVELIPMGDLLVAILILFAVILAVGLLARTNGGF